jgi:cell division protease FtsH
MNDDKHHGDAPTSDTIEHLPDRPAATRSAAAGMGTLQTEVYKREWRESLLFRRHEASDAEDKGAASRTISGFSSLRDVALAFGDDDEAGARARRRDRKPVRAKAADVASRLLLARAIDSSPRLLDELRSSTPVVVVDVPDGQVLDRMKACWADVVFPGENRLSNIAGTDAINERATATFLVLYEVPKAKDKADRQRRALAALSLPLPMLAFSPMGSGYLPEVVLKACSHRIETPRLDATIIALTIRVVTGRPCRWTLPADVAGEVGLDDLVIAVRSDRSPDECLDELRRLHRGKDLRKPSRDLSLDQLHGLGEARIWADATLADLTAWKSGTIPWSAVQNSICVVGPPGTGKTTFGRVFGAAAGLPVHLCTLATWQGSGEGHLGHLLRAMAQDFAKIRSAPSVVVIDEIDSFADRGSIKHSHKDYVVEVVNAFLTEVDAAKSTEGIVLIACTNDERRCDPALLRAGRFNPVVRIGLPDVDELELMMRVRLGGDLKAADLGDVAELAVGMTGADVEKLVNDAKRLARLAKRPMQVADLRDAIGVVDDRPPEMLWRTAVHEAGHIVADVVLSGILDVSATIAATSRSWGAYTRSASRFIEGTAGDYRVRIQVVLAGREAERLLLSSVSHGAGAEFGSDLSIATDLACAMAGSLGLAGPAPLVFLGPASDARNFLLFDEIREAVKVELSEAESACRTLLQRHRLGLEAVARRLLERGRIGGNEVAALLGMRGRQGGKLIDAPTSSDPDVENSWPART